MAASALTTLQIVNRILRRMREEEVANYNSTTYSTKVTDVLNQVKSEMESAWQWHALRNTFTITTLNNSSSYSLTGSGMNARIIDAWNTTRGLQMEEGTYADFNMKFFGVGSNNIATGSPTHILKSGLDANYDTTVDLWPIPVTGYLDTVKVNLYVPQADLAADATVPLLPQDVLIEETIARLKVERGDEDMPKPMPGETFILQDLLDSAIAADRGVDDSEMDWEVE